MQVTIFGRTFGKPSAATPAKGSSFVAVCSGMNRNRQIITSARKVFSCPNDFGKALMPGGPGSMAVEDLMNSYGPQSGQIAIYRADKTGGSIGSPVARVEIENGVMTMLRIF